MTDEKPKPATREVTETIERALNTPAKPKGGRPPKIEGKPWEAEGISRRTWYNRQKQREGA